MDIYKQLDIINREIELIDLKIDLAVLKGRNDSCELYEEEKKSLIEKKKNLLNGLNNLDNPNNVIEENQILLGDCMDYLPLLKPNSVDMVLSDIPYGINLDEWDVIHNNTNSALLGTSPAQKEKGAGFKRRGKPINGWNEDDKNITKYYENWCYKWAQMLYPAVKEAAPILIFGGRRTMHAAIKGFERAGFLLKDVLAWKKESSHHRSQDIFKVLVRRGRFKITTDTIKKLERVVDNNIFTIKWLEKLKDLIDIEFESSKIP